MSEPDPPSPAPPPNPRMLRAFSQVSSEDLASFERGDHLPGNLAGLGARPGATVAAKGTSFIHHILARNARRKGKP